jgi:hypothetical protein
MVFCHQSYVGLKYALNITLKYSDFYILNNELNSPQFLIEIRTIVRDSTTITIKLWLYKVNVVPN